MGLLLALGTGSLRAGDWPAWRGPSGNGVSTETGLPLRWSPTQNVAWTLALPGSSAATPIVWGERIFLNVADGESLELWFVRRDTGKVAWKRPLGAGNVKMRKHDMSSPSPVVDESGVYVVTGTGVVKGVSLDGRELWARDLQEDYGPFGLNWGYASSPLLFGDSLYVQVLHGMNTDAPSYLLRIDKTSGRTRWRVLRPTSAIRESPDAYTTPALVRRGEQAEIVVTGGDCATGHDPATGSELWRADGLNPGREPDYRIVASPVVMGELVYTPTRVRPLLALRAGGRGDVTRTHRVWSFDDGPDVPTPVTDGTYFYVVNDKGLAWCLDAQTGAVRYGPQRLKPGAYSASPVLADGRIYVTNEDGLTSVFKAGPTFEMLAENPLDDYTLASPAISDGQIFLRTAGRLWAIGARAGR